MRVGSRLTLALQQRSLHDGKDKAVPNDYKFNLRWEIGIIHDQAIRQGERIAWAGGDIEPVISFPALYHSHAATGSSRCSSAICASIWFLMVCLALIVLNGLGPVLLGGLRLILARRLRSTRRSGGARLRRIALIWG